MPTPAPAANATRTPPGSSLVPGSGSSGPAGTPAPHMTPTLTLPNSASQPPDLTQGTEADRRPPAVPAPGALRPARRRGAHGGLTTHSSLAQPRNAWRCFVDESGGKLTHRCG